jgi:hypothetical protein
MLDRPMIVRTIVALTVASIGIVVISSGGVVALSIGVFLFINAFLVLGALVRGLTSANSETDCHGNGCRILLLKVAADSRNCTRAASVAQV